MKIDIKWPINEMGGTHVVKDMIRITCNDVWGGSQRILKRGGKGHEEEENSKRTGVLVLDAVVHEHLSITVACIYG